ncbi:MAG TPA: hypothetical protein VMI54_22310, partial [Polyangiaceae bacterium]|nr:hypothetical protein [Polyangiaceae bacterium]
MRQPVRELLETVFAFHRPAALGALVCLAACSPPPRPIAARASVPAPAAAPVIPPFAAHAPAHTRLLLSVRLDPQGANSPLDSLAPLFGNCDFALRRDVERIDVALAEPKEFRLDLSGGVSLEAIRCVLGALEERG